MTRSRLAAAFVGALLVLLPAWSTAVDAAPRDVFTAFTPERVAPGAWTEREVDPFAALATNAGVCPTGGTRMWERSDSVKFFLTWWSCSADAARDAAGDVFKRRIDVGKIPDAFSYLDGADVVEPIGRTAVRTWVQASHMIQIGVTCPRGQFARCAAMSGEAARHLAAELPDKPLVTGMLPEFSSIVAGLVTAYMIFIGITSAVRWRLRPRYDAGDRDSRLTSVEPTARALRSRQRRRRVAWVLAILSALPLGGAVLNPQDGSLLFAARFAAFLTMLGLAVLLLRRWRHPMLGAAVPGLRRFQMGRLSTRRVAGTLILLLQLVVLTAMPLVLVAVLVLLGYLIRGGSTGMTDGDARMLFASAVIGLIGLGFLIDRIGRRLRMHTAQEMMSADRRPHILYLRNFGDDAMKVPASALGRSGFWQILTGWLNPVRTNRFEEILARALYRFGPVIAVDPPGTRLSRLGAAKTLLPHDNWFDRVAEWAQGAYAVVVSAAPEEIRPGLLQELEMIAERLPHGRVVLVLGPHRRKADTRAAIERFQAAVRSFPLFSDLAERPVADGTLVLAHLPNLERGTWQGWSARYRTAWTYTAAVHQAMTAAGEAWSAPVRQPA